MELFSLLSGSSGNCVITGDDSTHVMIDAGTSGKRIEAGLNAFDYSTKDMAALLITHEHSDHIAGVGVLARKYHLPIYATAGTIHAMRRMKSLGQIDEELYHVVRPDEDFSVGSLTITPFKISHDAMEPVAYKITNGKHSTAVCTDLGQYNDYIIEHLSGLDAMLLESNHDVHMLQVGSYPYELKCRILGERGHLSNENSGRLLAKVLHDNLKGVLLGHLSHENNYPDLAFETVKLEVDMSDNNYKASDFNISVANRETISERIVI